MTSELPTVDSSKLLLTPTDSVNPLLMVKAPVALAPPGFMLAPLLAVTAPFSVPPPPRACPAFSVSVGLESWEISRTAPVLMKIFALLAMEASLAVIEFTISASTPLLTVVEPL